jgi:hypothetical protein
MARGALLAALLALAAAPSAAVPAVAPYRAAVQDSWRSARAVCEKAACSHLPRAEADNCVHACMAPPCYELVYASAPLEPGEVNAGRMSTFNKCLGELERTLRARRGWPPAIDPITKALVVPTGEDGRVAKAAAA